MKKIQVRIPPDYFDTPTQRLNGQSLCPGCGAVGRKQKLCLGCEDGRVLVIDKSLVTIGTLTGAGIIPGRAVGRRVR